ncbi:MAG: beta strand repeat-containing protein, partial [Bacteroidota bacterium]
MKLKFLPHITLFSFLLLAEIPHAFAQPANDNPCSATNMGTLPAPGACVGGLQNGAPTTLNNQSTVGATGATPYVYQTGCSGGGQQASPALDTWYSFVASGNQVNVNITGFPNASVALWTGACNNLQAWGCANIPAGGSGTLTAYQLVIGQTYWIEISGNNATATDASFTLAVDNDIDCNDCLQTASITATPAPVNGGYTAGQVVTFCYTVSGWIQQNTNWFHGVQITYGAGWTGGITNPNPANTVQNIPGPGSDGDWLFFPTGIGTVNGQPWGTGFYFDTPDAGTNANNNFGDNCDGAGCSWTFCWDLTVGACTPGMNLNVTVNTSGDGESGSWSNNGCNDDNATSFNAIGICCGPPTMTQTNVTCFGGTNGTATATPGSGASPWDFVWTNAGGTTIQTANNVAGANTVSGLAAGTYNVTITDNNGCVSTGTVTITQPPLLTATQAHTNPPCFGGTTTATITATGGVAPYNVSWTGTTSGNPGGTEIAASGGTYNMTALGAGTYNVTVTDASGCTATVAVVVTVPAAVAVTGVPTNPACVGGTGSILVTGSGGTAGYNISWSGAASGNPAGTEIAASGGTYTITGLLAGSYTVTITDANGCTTNTPVTINPGVTIDANITPVAAQCLTGNSFNFSGSGSTISSGSITSYSWNFGAGATPATGSGVNPPAVTYSTAGTITVSLTVSNGTCTNTENLSVTINAPPTISGTPTPVTCNGGTNGSINVTASGGNPGYNVSWAGPSSGNPAGTEIAASGGSYNITGLAAGSYTITVTSAAGCVATTTVNVTQPTAVTASNTTTPVSCNGGTNGVGTITASGGTAGYNVSWTGTTSGNPAGTEIAASGGTYNMTGLGAGTYNVTVTDANGCTATTTVTITQPTGVTASNTTTPVSCNGGTNGVGTITASGGTAGYNVSWTGTTSGNPAGTEIAASGGTYNMTGLGAGTYNVTVTDANGCTATTTVTITQP